MGGRIVIFIWVGGASTHLAEGVFYVQMSVTPVGPNKTKEKLGPIWDLRVWISTRVRWKKRERERPQKRDRGY